MHYSVSVVCWKYNGNDNLTKCLSIYSLLEREKGSAGSGLAVRYGRILVLNGLNANDIGGNPLTSAWHCA